MDGSADGGVSDTYKKSEPFIEHINIERCVETVLNRALIVEK